MTEKPTLANVAEAAGVSIPTVSQVMRGTGRISEKTRKKVMDAADRLHYIPDSRAAAMRSGDNREIGFVINQFSNPFNAEVVSGAVDLLEAEGYLVSILDTRDDAERQARQLDAFIRNGRGGLMWVPAARTTDDTLDRLHRRRIPTVTFLRPVDQRFDHVGIRNAEATAMATDHLIQLGHRHIAYLGGTEMSYVRRERIAGYSRVMIQDSGTDPVIWPSRDSKADGLAAMEALMTAHPEVTAIVCNGDMVALGACLAAQRRGLTPGSDISVVGFDDIQDAGLATPALTTMAAAPNKLGRMLARALLDRINDPDMPLTVSEVTADLIVRKTTGAPKT